MMRLFLKPKGLWQKQSKNMAQAYRPLRRQCGRPGGRLQGLKDSTEAVPARQAVPVRMSRTCKGKRAPGKAVNGAHGGLTGGGPALLSTGVGTARPTMVSRGDPEFPFTVAVMLRGMPQRQPLHRLSGSYQIL